VPGGREDDLWMVDGHGQIRGADVRAEIERFRPTRATIARLEDAPLGIRAVGMPQSGDIHDVGTLGIDDNLADLPRVAETEVRPGLAAIGGLVDAIARGKIGTDVGLACAHVDHLGIRPSHGEGTDRRNLLAVEDRLPDNTGIAGLPDPAIDRAKIEGGRVAANTGDGYYSPSAKRPDEPPPEPRVELGGNGLGGKGDGGCEQADDRSAGKTCKVLQEWSSRLE